MKRNIKQEMMDVTFSNLCFGIVIGSFLFFLNLGYINIKPDIFLTDVKILGIIVAFIAIFVFERAYSLDDDELAIQGIEIFVASLIVLGLQILLKSSLNFIQINSMIIFFVLLYYTIKSAVIVSKMKKKEGK